MNPDHLDGYRMSFGIGGLMVNESVALAQFCGREESWPDVRARLLAEGISSFPKAASQTRILRELFDRMRHLSKAEREHLVGDADREEKNALIWLAICRTYRFIREFAVEVIGERYASWRLDLGQDAFDRFLVEKAEMDPALLKLSQSTCVKLRQVTFRILREAGILGRDNRIQPVWLPSRLKMMIADESPDDLLIFPGNGR